VPSAAASLDYDQYRRIEFKREAAEWTPDGAVPFRVHYDPRGYLFNDEVKLNIVENGVALPRPYAEEDFAFFDLPLSDADKTSIGFAGFHVTTPLNSSGKFDDLISFKGASFFRALSAGTVYGASARGTVGEGIGNVEFGYYDSDDDPGGDDGRIDNSQLRFLVGYTQELAKDFTAGMQYYVEHMMDYSAYRASLMGGRARDQNRHVVTLRLTQLMMNQNLRLSLFTYYSPSDEDAYIRPNLHYKATDNLALELGANIFFGDEPHTFFAQFQNDTNVYAAVRYTF